MKKLLICLLVMLMPTLAACGGYEPMRAPHEVIVTIPPQTPSPTLPQDPAPAPEPTPLSAPVPESYPAYRDLVDDIRHAFRDGADDSTVDALGISDVFKRMSLRELGWLQADVNGDGVDELLLGANGSGDEPGPIYDIYTMLGDTLSHPVRGWEFSRWYVLEDGLLVNEASNDGYDRCCTAYGFYNGILVHSVRNTDRSEYLRLSFESFEN